MPSAAAFLGHWHVRLVWTSRTFHTTQSQSKVSQIKHKQLYVTMNGLHMGSRSSPLAPPTRRLAPLGSRQAQRRGQKASGGAVLVLRQQHSQASLLRGRGHQAD